MSHTPTPWEVGVYNADPPPAPHIVIMAPKAKVAPGKIRMVACCGQANGDLREQSTTDAQRIINCVHALEGWEDPADVGEVVRQARRVLEFAQHWEPLTPGDIAELRAALERAPNG